MLLCVRALWDGHPLLSISVWQHVKLSVQIRPAWCWDVKQASNRLKGSTGQKLNDPRKLSLDGVITILTKQIQLNDLSVSSSSVFQSLSVAQFIQTPTTNNAFLWYRSQREVHLFCKMTSLEVVALWAPLSSCTVFSPCLTLNPQPDRTLVTEPSV